MSEILRIRDFAQKGLNTDIVPWDLDPGFLTDMLNVRIINNEIGSFGGYKNWTTPPLEFNPGWLIHGGVLSAEFWLVAGATAIYSWDGTNWTDISSAVGYPSINKELWVGDVFSSFIVMTHPDIYPEYWTGVSAGTQVLPLPFDATRTFSDVDIRMGIIRSHKDFLIGLDLNEQGEELIDSVRWSDAADVGQIPRTWDETDPAALAGIAQLGGSAGRVIDGLPLRDAFAVYRENGITMMDYTGDIFVWRFRHLENTTGLINKDCVVEVQGTHFFISDGDILANDGNNVRSIMHKRIRKRFVGTINTAEFHKSYVFKNDLAKEIWFCVPEGIEAVFPNVAYVYNWKDDSWFIRELNPEVIFASYGPESGAIVRTWDAWNEPWNEAKGVWGQLTRTPLNQVIVGIVKGDDPSRLIVIDGANNDNVEDYLSFMERTDYPLTGIDKVTTIKTIYPQMTGTVDVKIRLGSQQRAGGPISWKPFITFNPSTDRKLDIRTTGVLHCFRIEAASSLGAWSFSGMDIDYEEAGAR